MNLSYKEFMRNSIIHDNSFDDLELVSHGSNKETFKQVYEDYYLEDNVEIYRLDDPKILRLGFVIIDNSIREWHTVRFNAWKSHNDFIKEMKGEKNERKI